MTESARAIIEPHRATAGQNMLTALALLAVGTIPLLPAALGGHFPRTHEGMRYEHLASLFLDALRHGIVSPRWLPQLDGGYGYPIFVFYQPIVFYVASLLSAFSGARMIAAIQFTDLLFAVIGSFGAYFLARGVGALRIASIASAALFLITPYAFVNLYVRGDHSEFAAMMLTPWPIAMLLLARRRWSEDRSPRGPLYAAAGFVALIIPTHPAVALNFVPLLFVLAGVMAFELPGKPTRGMRFRWLIALAGVAILAAALSSAYWLPVIQCRGFVRIEDVTRGPFDPLEHTAEPFRLLTPAWEFGTSGYKSRGVAPTMSFQLGLPHLLLALGGVILGWRRPWVIAVAVAYLLLALAMTNAASAIWQPGSPLRILQFPWRLLSTTASLQLLLAATLFGRVASKRPAVQSGIAIACVCVAAIWYHAMFRTSPRSFTMTDGTSGPLSWTRAQRVLDDGLKTLPRYAEDFSGQGEFAPRWSPRKIVPRVGPTLLVQGDVSESPESTPYRLDASVRCDSNHLATLQQFYFPGWCIEVNGRRLADDAVTPDELGRMRFPVPAGTSHITAWYDGPPFWRTRTACAAIIALLASGLLWRITRKTQPANMNTSDRATSAVSNASSA